MFIALFIILLGLWVIGFGVMHTAGFLIHLLLIAAIISLVLHLISPRGTTNA